MKIKLSFRFFLARRETENYKKIGKKLKKFKIPLYHLFKPKNIGEGRKREKNELYPSVSFLPNPEIENSKKVAKKFKKLKNTITASFHVKIGWKRLRNKENKNYHSVSFLPDT